MSHMVETMAYAYKKGSNTEAYQVPWHGLGTPIEPGISVREMLKVSGLDWKVERHPTFARIDGREVYTGKDVLARNTDGKILTHVSEGWNEVQNEMFAHFFEEFVEAGHMEMNTMGSLNDGKMVWALAKVGESFELFKGRDKVEAYLLFSNPHQYGKCVDIRFTAIRAVCKNTLTLALNTNAENDMMVRLNHSRAFDPEQVKEALGISSDRLATYREAAEFLVSKSFSEETLNEFLTEVFPSQSKNEDEVKLSRPHKLALEHLDTQPGADLGRGTWWHAFNTVTFVTDHLQGRSEDTRLASAWYGPNRTRKVNALEKAVEFANAA